MHLVISKTISTAAAKNFEVQLQCKMEVRINTIISQQLISKQHHPPTTYITSPSRQWEWTLWTWASPTPRVSSSSTPAATYNGWWCPDLPGSSEWTRPTGTCGTCNATAPSTPSEYQNRRNTSPPPLYAADVASTHSRNSTSCHQSKIWCPFASDAHQSASNVPRVVHFCSRPFWLILISVYCTGSRSVSLLPCPRKQKKKKK